MKSQAQRFKAAHTPVAGARPLRREVGTITTRVICFPRRLTVVVINVPFDILARSYWGLVSETKIIGCKSLINN